MSQALSSSFLACKNLHMTHSWNSKPLESYIRGGSSGLLRDLVHIRSLINPDLQQSRKKYTTKSPRPPLHAGTSTCRAPQGRCRAASSQTRACSFGSCWTTYGPTPGRTGASAALHVMSSVCRIASPLYRITVQRHQGRGFSSSLHRCTQSSGNPGKQRRSDRHKSLCATAGPA